MCRFVSKLFNVKQFPKERVKMENKKQTNYDVIKNMSLPEMAAMLYIFAKPFYDFLNMSDEVKEQTRKKIVEVLEAEAGTDHREA